ncbi:MAG TPA: DUF4340 domain-containing protein [Candidatus Brocadiia bacterium]|nr:DUF4340 domain-containing protein [Candidatus Brocadiales bacterium]
MKLKTTIILLIVAVIGFAYVFLYERKQFTTDQIVQRAGMVFPDFNPDRVNRIEIKKGDLVTLLEKTDKDTWTLQKPINVKADKAEVNSILSEFQYMKKISSIKDTSDLKSYGLEEPVFVASLWTGATEPTKAEQGKKEHTIYVGSKRAGGDEAYIRLEGGNEMLLVPGTILDKFGKSVSDLRTKKVLDIETEAVEKIELQYASGEAISCVRKENNWHLTKPVSDLCDNEMVVEIINKLKNLKIDKNDFVTEDDSNLTKYGFDTPKITVAIEQKGVAETVIFGHSLDNKVYTKHKDAPSIFMITETVLADLSKKPNDIRDRKVCRFEPLHVKKLNLKLGETTVTTEKTKEYDWQFISPPEANGMLADTDSLKGLINAMQGMEIQNFVADNQEDTSALGGWGLDIPVADVEIFKEGGESLVHIQVGKKDEKGKLCYIRRSGENSVFMVKTDDFYDRVSNPLLALRDRLIIEYEKENAERLTIEKKDRTFVCEKSKDDPAKWMLIEPVKTAADMIPVNNIIWGLAFFKAESYVTQSPENLSEFGLDNPTMKVTVSYKETVEETAAERKKDTEGDIYLKPKTAEGPPVTKTLLIGKKVKQDENANSYAMLEGGDLVFEIGWTELKDFEAELAPTRLLPFDKALAKVVCLTYNDKEVSYEFKRETWEMVKPESRDVDRREVEVLTYTLENLRAEAIECYSTNDLAQFGLDNPWFKASVGLEDKEYVLHVGKKASDNTYYAKNTQSDFIYIVKAEDIDKLMGVETTESPATN